jgi:WD40 repeat protein
VSRTSIVIRQSPALDCAVHAIAMAGWHQLVSLGVDNKVRLHNPETGRILDTFEGLNRYVTGLRPFDDRCVLLLLGNHYGLLNLETGVFVQADTAELSELRDRLSPTQLMVAPMLAPVTFAPPRTSEVVAEAGLDPSRILYATEDRLNDAYNQQFHVWNVHRGREERSFLGTDSGLIGLIALDRRQVLSSHEDEMFRFWDVETGDQLRRFAHRCGKAGALALIDGGLVLFATVNPNEVQRLNHRLWPPSDRTLRLWDIETATELASLQCAAAISDVARLDGSRFWARDEQSRLHLVEVLR